MSILSSILDKLGLHKPAAPAVTPAPAAPATPVAPPAPAQNFTAPSVPYYVHTQNVPPPAATPPTPPTPPPLASPVEMPMVDVVSHLEYLAKTSPIQGLNWKQSINDLMALLGLSHTPQDIKDLAVELGCPEKEMGDSYSRNVWTYQALMKKIAENGGNVPPSLLH